MWKYKKWLAQNWRFTVKAENSKTKKERRTLIYYESRKNKNRIDDCVTLFGFEYRGKEGNVDPCYIHEEKRYEYLFFFDGEEQTVYEIDSVMNTPFIMGHTLNELAEEIEITEW